MDNISGSHKISGETIQLAKEHAEESQRHGKTIEEMGKKLRENGHPDLEAAQQVEDSGKAVQKHAQGSLQKIENLQGSQSTEDYIQISQKHIEEAQAHITATKAYREILAQRLQESKAVQDDLELS
jgi:hypothetical protein